MNTIEGLKFVVLDEWTYDPPAGAMTLYYADYFYNPAEVKPLIEEIIDHIKVAIGYEENDKEELEDEDYRNEIEGLDPIAADGVLTIENLREWSWDNGGAGCGCVLYAEGKDIVDSAIRFYEDTLEEDDYDDDDWDEDDEDNNIDDKTKIEDVIEAAETNPENVEAVMSLLHMIFSLIEKRNDSMW